jgi:hypothetical protein
LNLEARTSNAGRRTPALVIGLALAVLAGVVILTTLQVRQSIRDQIAGRDGEVLYAVALMHYGEDVKEGLAGPITGPAGQLASTLKSAQLRGVLGVRLFDTNGGFVESFPPDVTEAGLASAHLPALRRLNYVAEFHPRVRMDELFYAETAAEGAGIVPVLEINVPLHTEKTPLAGIAQFLVEGRSIAAEYARLDRHLALQGFTAFAAGGTVLTGALIWAFRRLRRAQIAKQKIQIFKK